MWPPRFSKFSIQTTEPKVEAAFTDSRRFSRIRLLNCAAEAIRDTTPLKENGPDPVIDKDILTVEWLEEKLNKKQVPIKALLLDQSNISGIGNWVGSVIHWANILIFTDTISSDEILYHARLHPEQYSNTFSSEEIKRLHASMMYICETAVKVLADSSKFPDDWMFKHRWGKGKKDGPTALPNGENITFITVGGRTSCVVPSLQKRTGAAAGDPKKRIASSDNESIEDVPVKKQSSRKRNTAVVSPGIGESDEETAGHKRSKVKSRKSTKIKDEMTDEDAGNIPTKSVKLTKEKKSKSSEARTMEIQPRRRSSRHMKTDNIPQE